MLLARSPLTGHFVERRAAGGLLSTLLEGFRTMTTPIRLSLADEGLRRQARGHRWICPDPHEGSISTVMHLR